MRYILPRIRGDDPAEAVVGTPMPFKQDGIHFPRIRGDDPFWSTDPLVD